MSSTDLPSRSRRFHSKKVRTGCITCKIRRVKCDEQKPNCMRCASTGRKCDGYAQSDSETHFQVVPFHRESSVRFGISVLSDLGDNVQYLEFYHRCAGPTLASNFDSEFWCRICLQIAYSEPAVRHALIALGYLHRTEPGSLRHARSRFVTDRGGKTLLLHYNKAIKCLIERIAEPSYSAEIGLVTCVLFICIEFMRGNYVTAFDHWDSGLKMITQWLRMKYHDSSRLTLAFQPSGSSSSRSSSPRHTSSDLRRYSHSDTIIEQKLIPMFTRMTINALLFGRSIEHIFELSGHILELSVPVLKDLRAQPFSTILEAQCSSHELANHCILWARSLAIRKYDGDPITAEDFEHQEYLLGYHDVLLRRLESFEEKTNPSPEEIVIISTLKAAYHCTYIAVSIATQNGTIQCDQHIDRYKAIIQHARVVLESMKLDTSLSADVSSPQSKLPPAKMSLAHHNSSHTKTAISSQTSPAANFTFEISIVPALYTTALQCRCPVTRREAVRLLRLNPPREGLWDPKQIALVSERVIEMEETELDPRTGWPAERSRLWSVVINGDMDADGGFWVGFSAGGWFNPKRLLEKTAALEHLNPPKMAGQLPSMPGGGEGRMWEAWFVLKDD